MLFIKLIKRPLFLAVLNKIVAAWILCVGFKSRTNKRQL